MLAHPRNRSWICISNSCKEALSLAEAADTFHPQWQAQEAVEVLCHVLHSQYLQWWVVLQLVLAAH